MRFPSMESGLRVSLRPLRFGAGYAALLLLGVTLVGCAGHEWPLQKEGAKPVTATDYYVGAESLPLHRTPGGEVRAQLPRGAKVSRRQIEKGWAFVRVAASGQEGWVDNAKLSRRAPRAASAAPAPATPSATPAASEPAADPESAAPAPAETPAETPAPQPSKPGGTSVFDPF